MTRYPRQAAFVMALPSFGCGSPEPKAPRAAMETVPANSASEQHMRGVTPTPPPEQNPIATTGTLGAASAPATSNGDRVSKAECRQLFDYFIDLSIGSDARLQGLPAEVVAQLKQQAQAEASGRAPGGDPCETQSVSHAQYTCAMRATSVQAWQRCLE